MKELLEGSLAPITNTFGFLQCNALQAAEMFVGWQGSIQAKRGVSVSQTKIQGQLQTVIQSLLPLNSVERRRYLFISTRSNWTAFLDNGHQGTDVFSPLSFMAEKLSCNAVRATCIPEGRRKGFPAAIFEMYGPERTDFLNYIRSVAVAYDGKKWSFSAAGEIQPFEDTEKYSSRRIEDRFTPEMLKNYLEALGIFMFDADFYLTDGDGAIRVEKKGPIAPAAREYSLEDLQ